MALEDYDGDTPFSSPEDNPDEFVIGGGAGDITVPSSMKDADTLERENTFSTPKPGEHVLQVLDFPYPPSRSLQHVYIDGRLEAYETHTIKVRFALPNNHRCTIDDYFVLPPSDPKYLRAYFEGVPKTSWEKAEKEGKKPGALGPAQRFIHFLNRIGFRWTPGTRLPADAAKLGNWKHWPDGKPRLVAATVAAGQGTYLDKNGVERPSQAQIRWMSYKEVPRGQGGGNGGNGAAGAPRGGEAPAPGQPQAARPTQTPQAQAPRTADQLAASGLRNL